MDVKLDQVAGQAAPVPTNDAAKGATRRAFLLASKPVFYNLVSVVGALIAWHLLSLLVKSPFFPSPDKILTAFIHLAAEGDTSGNSLWTHCWSSLYRVMVGFSLAVILGVPVGLLMGLNRPLYVSTRAIVEPFRFIPPIAWIPLAIIFFAGTTRFAFLIFLGAFFPIYTATHVGVSRVEPIHRKVFMVHGASKFQILAHVVIPTVLPDVLGGMRVAMGAAWLTIVAAELTGGTGIGLGRMMVDYAELLKIPEVIVGMLLIGAIGFALNEMLLLLEKRLFRWRWQVTL
jgi:ABC-type nitrate/sulfonate/bicarbonate transport system permease component